MLVCPFCKLQESLAKLAKPDKAPQPPSPFQLHLLTNAGNDAAYTLAAMIHMADHGMPPPKTDKNETDEFAASLRPNVYPAPEDDDIEVLAAKVEKLPTGYVDFEDMIDGGTVKFDKQEGDVKKRNRRND